MLEFISFRPSSVISTTGIRYYTILLTVLLSYSITATAEQDCKDDPSKPAYWCQDVRYHKISSSFPLYLECGEKGIFWLVSYTDQSGEGIQNGAVFNFNAKVEEIRDFRSQHFQDQQMICQEKVLATLKTSDIVKCSGECPCQPGEPTLSGDFVVVPSTGTGKITCIILAAESSRGQYKTASIEYKCSECPKTACNYSSSSSSSSSGALLVIGQQSSSAGRCL